MQEVPQEGAALAAEPLVLAYRAMKLARALDERLVALQHEAVIGYAASAQGEEAAIVGATFALRRNDWVFPTPREWGAAIARGMPVAAYLAHVFGAAADSAKGRQMATHFSYKAANVASVAGVAGAHLPHAVGFAWAARTKKDDRVALAFFAASATSEGDFHNAMNFAGVAKAPVVFVCRNDGASRHTASESFAEKAVAYGVRGLSCDGNDACAVIDAVKEAVSRASHGEGATLLEAHTKPFAAGDLARAACPLARLRVRLEQAGAMSAAKDVELTREIDAELDRAIEAARSLPPPSPASMFDDVYETAPPHLAEERDLLSRSPRAPHGFRSDS